MFFFVSKLASSLEPRSFRKSCFEETSTYILCTIKRHCILNLGGSHQQIQVKLFLVECCRDIGLWKLVLLDICCYSNSNRQLWLVSFDSSAKWGRYSQSHLTSVLDSCSYIMCLNMSRSGKAAYLFKLFYFVTDCSHERSVIGVVW